MTQAIDEAEISRVNMTVTPETIQHLDNARECALARLQVCSSALVSETEQAVRMVRATRRSDPAMQAVKPPAKGAPSKAAEDADPPGDITARFAALNHRTG